MKRFIFGSLAVVAVAGTLAVHAKLVAVASPGPTPVALQYEEITRIEYPPATPIPPGSFGADRSAIMASASTPAPSHHGLFAGVLNNVQGAMGEMQSTLQHGTLERYTYYNGWVRIDNVTAQTATITKCSQHQYITLDLLHHTYTITSTVPSPAPAPAPGGYSQQGVTNEAPGTVDMTVQVQSQNLGPRTLEGIPTHGSHASISLVMSHATGSCRNGSMSMQIVQYVSGIGIPRAYCPLPRVSSMQGPGGTVVRGGCKPAFHGNASGESLMMGNGDDLGMYRRATYSSAQTNGNNFGFVTEAGSVRWLYKPDAEALFTIPPGFTRQQ